jgi:integrase
MRGNKTRRGPNTWQFKVYAGRGDDGAKQYVHETFHGTERQAETALAKLVAQVADGRRLPSNCTVGQLLDAYLAKAKPKTSPNTFRGYQLIAEKTVKPRYGDWPATKLDGNELEDFYDHLMTVAGPKGKPLGPQSIRNVNAVIRRAYKFGVRRKLVATVPTDGIELPSLVAPQLYIPTPTDVAALIALGNERDVRLGRFLRLGATAGPRRGESCALRYTDHDHVNSTLRIARSIAGRRNGELVEKDTKTHASRTITLDRSSNDMLTEQRREAEARATVAGIVLPDDAFIFSDELDGSRPWSPDRLTRAFTILRTAAGLHQVRLHDLRHFMATQMLANGVAIAVVSERLGHVNPHVTLKIYTHALANGDEAAADMLARILDNVDGPTTPPPGGVVIPIAA